ncbi:TPA: toxin [Aeromonas hydrophila]|uniref:zonular occludens toxin domain-containing protein n=1 Tax=Aeromonas hydrophila TaxID=644 RepID=UPI0009C08CC1|nr:zonular occludens toxin domain-containing protein [Aeromonas hydrophila]HAU4877801.1 toxin [Aeromonas hydrophila]
MAIVIEHGHNGSYKSSSVIWFRLLPALREGRVVVTNVAGMFPLHRIEEFLGEKFPETARLFRVSSQDPKSQQLWRIWHHWMPIGAFVFIDECQDIYDRDVFNGKPEYNIKPIDFYDEVLPPELIQIYKDTLNKFKPDNLDDCDVDDTGRVVFDEQGKIIYPTTPQESFMRHRHFNWDVVLATPNIRSIPVPVRACCEVAFAYSSKDSFAFSKRKPRIYEHNPLDNGIPTKQSVTFKRRVPVAVHRLYKSTQTGAVTKSGQSTGPLSSFKVRITLFGLVPALLVTFIYLVYGIVNPESASPEKPAEVVSAQGTAAPAGAVAVPVSDADDRQASVGTSPRGFLMPYRVTELFVTGSSGALYNGRFEGLVLFSGMRGQDELAFNSDDLINIGYRVDYLGDCYSVVTDRSGRAIVVNCAPRIVKPDLPKSDRPNMAIMPENVTQLANVASNVAS